MAASVSSPADIVNLALAAIGYQGRVGNLFDGSAAANRALDIFAEARDEVLRSRDWPFALRQRAGAAGVVVPAGWAFSWAYPDDCIRVRSISPGVIPSPNYDPRPLEWTVFNDFPAGSGNKLILTQVTPVKINYVGQVTTISQWDPLFVDAVVQTLSVKLGPALKMIQPAINAPAAIAAAALADEKLAPDDAAPAPAQPQPATQSAR